MRRGVSFIGHKILLANQGRGCLLSIWFLSKTREKETHKEWRILGEEHNMLVIGMAVHADQARFDEP